MTLLGVVHVGCTIFIVPVPFIHTKGLMPPAVKLPISPEGMEPETVLDILIILKILVSGN